MIDLGPLRWLNAVITKPGDSGPHSAQRRAFAIHAYVGANGGGKSLAMVHDTLSSLRRGRPVLSTVRLLDVDDPHACGDRTWDDCDDAAGHVSIDGEIHRASHPGYVPFRDFEQLLTFERGDVLMDEVTGVASSRESHSMPAPVVNYLMQVRRRDVLLRWTAPNWARADKVIREVTQAVTNCSGSFPVTGKRDDGTDRLWRDRRMFHWVTFDAFDFDEFTAHKRDNATPLVDQWYWRPNGDAANAYSTFDSVISLAAVDDSGRCIKCGRRRVIEPCYGHDERTGESLPRPTVRKPKVSPG